MKSKWQLILLAIFLGAGLSLGACLRRLWLEGVLWAGLRAAASPGAPAFSQPMVCTCGLLCGRGALRGRLLSSLRVGLGLHRTCLQCLSSGPGEVGAQGQGPRWVRGGGGGEEHGQEVMSALTLRFALVVPLPTASSLHMWFSALRCLLRQVALQAGGSSDEPLILLIQLKLKNNVEWKCFKKRNNTYVHKNTITHVLFQDTYRFNRTTETWVKIVFPVFRRVVTFEKKRREMDLGVGLAVPVVHFYSFIK